MTPAFFDDQVFKGISFAQDPLTRGVYEECRFSACDFSGSLLGEFRFIDCSFSECNLSNANFENTILEKADLRTAVNYLIDPESNLIHKARFALDGLPGLLAKYGIEIEI